MKTTKQNEWSASELVEMPTIHQGQCCDCKIDAGGVRVWICRVLGGVKVEQYKKSTGRWETVAGGCDEGGDGERAP